MDSTTRLATRILTYSLGAFLLILGADKAFHLELITDWEAYLGPISSTVFPFAAETVVRLQGCIELFLAVLLLFTAKKRLAIILFIISTLCVIVDLASHRFFILIARDVLLLAVAGALLVLLSSPGLKGKGS